MKISILLPYKENFSSKYAGAVSLFVKDTTVHSKFKNSIDSFGGGKVLKTAKYQKNNCNNKGIFLKISTYAAETFETKKFGESLAIPKNIPKIVAKNIPNTATNIVFNNPTK